MPLPGLDDAMPSLRLPSLGLGNSPSDIRRPLSAQEKQSFGGQLLGAGGSALGYVLGSLNKPGRAVRGLLGGKPGEALAAIPFSDTLGITNPDNEVTGRHLTDKLGITKKGNKSWGHWGAGLAADLVTDPLTYWTGGAKHAFTNGGRALERTGELAGWGRKSLLEGYHNTESALARSGTTPEVIAHLRDEGQRIASPAAEAAYQSATGQALKPGEALSGLGRLHMPFAPDLGVTVGQGSASKAIAGGLDRAARYASTGNLIGRQIGTLFDSTRKRAIGQTMQEAWQNVGTPTQKPLEASARGITQDTRLALGKILAEHPGQEVPVMRALKINQEQSSPLALLDSAKDPATRALYQTILGKTKALGDQVHGYGADWNLTARQAGAAGVKLKDRYIRYGPRQSTAADVANAGHQYSPSSSISPTSGRFDIRREEALRDLPGGTDRINDTVNQFAGNKDVPAIEKHLFDTFATDYAHMKGMPLGGPDLYDAPTQTLKAARYISGLDADKYLGKMDTMPYFTHNLVGTLEDRAMQHARTMGGASALVSGISKAARPVSSFGPGEKSVPLRLAMRKVGLKSHWEDDNIVGAGEKIARGLAPQGFGMVEPLTQGQTSANPLLAHLNQYAVPEKEWADIARQHAEWRLPTELKGVTQRADSLTNSFKALTYPIWLASHVRNMGTAGLNNMRTGTSLGDYFKQAKLLRGKLPPAEAEALIRDQYAHARIFAEGGQNVELAGAGSAKAASPYQWNQLPAGHNEHGIGARGPTGSFVGDTANLIGKEGVGDFFSGVGQKILHPKTAPNPFQLSGVANPLKTAEKVTNTDVLAPVVAGRKVSGNIENFMRGSQYNGLIRQGFSPTQAAEQINKYHFDYTARTPFERNVMSRMFPFYTYMRKNLPLQMDTIATRPAAFSTPLKPTQVDRDQHPYIPGYLNNGAAMPITPEVDGKQRFLSQLGLPQEEAFREMKTFNGLPDLLGTAMGFAGNLNPIIKAPLEQLADRQFYSGRRLSDLKPSAAASSLASLFSDEYAQPLSQFISNTPLTRFATGLEKLRDTQGIGPNGRKPLWATAANLGTGARITDVDLDKQRYFDQRNANERLLQSSPHVSHYSEYYVRPENRGLVTPEEAMRLRMLVDLQKQGRDARERARRMEQPR